MRGDGGIEAPASHPGLFANDDHQGRVASRDRHAGTLRAAFVGFAGRDPDQGHHAVARVRLLLNARIRQSELPANSAERVQHISDRDTLGVPGRLHRGCGIRAHGRCHSFPSAWINLSAAAGPQEPAAYMDSAGRSSLHAASMGSMNAHAASTSSARVKSVGSPFMQSRSRRAYASGVSTRKDDMYVKSMATFRRRRPALGTLAANRSEIPSSGWMRSVMALGARPFAASKVRCGGRLNWTRISVTRLGIRLPTRM